MATRISVSRAKSLLEKLHENIMEAVNLYFIASMTKWVSGMRGRSQAGSLATNPRTQAVQSPWKDSTTGDMQILPAGHTWGTSGSIARYDSIFTEPASPIVGLRMAIDVLLTRAQPPVIVYVAARALNTLPKTLLASECKKRLGAAGPAFVKWIAATNELAGVILEQGEKKKTRRKPTAISWAELSTDRTPRKKKAKTPSKAPKSRLVRSAIEDNAPNHKVTKDEAALLIALETIAPEACAVFDNGYDLGVFAQALLREHNTLQAIRELGKEYIVEFAHKHANR